MIKVESHSLGIDNVNDERARCGRIIHTKYFKTNGIRFKLYVFIQKLLEDYIDIEIID